MLSCKHANKILFQKIYPISFFVCMIIQVDLVLLWFQIGMGRKSHDIWAFYKKVEKNGKQRALCNHCMTDIVPLVERMKEHYQKCKAPSAAEDDVSKSEPGPSPPKIAKQTKLPFPSAKPSQKHEIDLQITRFVLMFYYFLYIIIYTSLHLHTTV